MRVVLYAHDMEPITIVDLKPWAHEFLVKYGTVVLAVLPAIRLDQYRGDEPIEACYWRVRITAEPLHRNGERHLMLFTHDEEHALLLKAAFLPGQAHTVRGVEGRAFAQGFLHALELLR